MFPFVISVGSEWAATAATVICPALHRLAPDFVLSVQPDGGIVAWPHQLIRNRE